MFLEQIILTNFKNYGAQKLEFSPRLNSFSGLNGMGKTNVLDAIYYLCLAKSRFGLPDNLLCRKGESFFRLDGKFIAANKSTRIVVKFQAGKRKVIEQNQSAYENLQDHIGQFPVVFIGPDDVSLITEGSEERRKFLDNTLSQTDPLYLSNLIIYNKILQLRNSALKQFAEQRTWDGTLLEAYQVQLVPCGTYIYQQRKAFMTDFLPEVQAAYHQIAGLTENMDCNYISALDQMPLDMLLESSLDKDRLLQRTTQGIHRDDLDFQIKGMSVKRFGSQGQLKSFVLALKLAQYRFLERRTNILPILLLDDIFDKLDAQRVSSLLNLLHESRFGQVFITDTDENRVENIMREFGTEYCSYRVNTGVAILQNQSPDEEVK